MIKKASDLYGCNQWILFNKREEFDLFTKIYKNGKRLEKVFSSIFQGIATSKDSLYVVEKVSTNPFKCRVPETNKVYELEKDLFKKFIKGKHVQRYYMKKSNLYVFFPYDVNNDAEIIPIQKIQEDYPKTYKYVTENEQLFKSRESGRAGKMEHWHAYIYPKNLEKFEYIKLSSMEICTSHPNVTLDKEKFYHNTKVYSWTKKPTIKESYEYLLSIANSSLLWWFLKLTGDTLRGDARTLKTNYLNPFPIPLKIDSGIELQIVEKVKKILKLKSEEISASTSEAENEIDRLVCGAYNLTDEEIRLLDH
jgi:hypothetical protein